MFIVCYIPVTQRLAIAVHLLNSIIFLQYFNKISTLLVGLLLGVRQVYHSKLIWKLLNYEIRSNVLDWIGTFLADRAQRVVVGGKESRLCLFNKIVNSMVAVSLPDYIQPNPRTSRRGHSRTFCQFHTAKENYNYSFSACKCSVECAPRRCY